GTVADQVAARRAAVAGHHHAGRGADGDDGGAVGDRDRGAARGGETAARVEALGPEQAGEAGARIGVGREDRQGHLADPTAPYSPPCWMYDFTKSSAFCSRTSSISSSRSSSSALIFSPDSDAAGTSSTASSSRCGAGFFFCSRSAISDSRSL